ncbi:MAG: ArsA family ATPase [Candidatus Aenigmarchaeota archaeon]|nr:ArsA family ATPase [Candidatus Aenigmarchaeota archaeon]
MLGLGKRETQFYLFAGKGGVGKTSIAAATALHFANRGKKTLIISTDPAHSLSDSFETKIGGEIQKLRKNLFAVEIDPKKAMSEYKEKIMPQIEKLDFLKGLGLEDTFDFAGNTPGIDEMAAFDKFLQYMQSKDYDIIIFDTAPTGHTLRFLSLPDVLDSWVGKMINIRLKFSGFINTFKKILPFGETKKDDQKLGTEQLEVIKERIEQARKILSDKEKTHFNLVLIPEAMSIYESERSLNVLKEYGIPIETVVVNQLIPENRKCPFCTEKRKLQQERTKEIRNKFKDYKLMEIPLHKEEVKGFGMLEKVGKELYS